MCILMYTYITIKIHIYFFCLWTPMGEGGEWGVMGGDGGELLALQGLSASPQRGARGGFSPLWQRKGARWSPCGALPEACGAPRGRHACLYRRPGAWVSPKPRGDPPAPPGTSRDPGVSGGNGNGQSPSMGGARAPLVGSGPPTVSRAGVRGHWRGLFRRGRQGRAWRSREGRTPTGGRRPGLFAPEVAGGHAPQQPKGAAWRREAARFRPPRRQPLAADPSWGRKHDRACEGVPTHSIKPPAGKD